jgi:hypothetical protein
MACKKQQVDILMKCIRTYTQEAAAAKAGMSLRTARRYLRELNKTDRAPRNYRTRIDPFIDVWNEVRTLLSRDCGLEANSACCLVQGGGRWRCQPTESNDNKKCELTDSGLSFNKHFRC